MRRWRLLLIYLVGLGWLLAAPVGAGTIRGSVACGERCADFVVYLEGVGGSYDGAGEVVELDQKNKTFIPHVLPLLKGSILRVGNDDPFLHNVHARKGGETVFNFNVLFQYQTVDQVVAEAGVYEISCEPHPEMSAVLVALDNPFFTQPDDAGRYSIENVPPGGYELVRLDAAKERRRTKPVRVGSGVTRADF
jgi:plastocyanin